MTKRHGFTLAEVLITLLVVGVVGAAAIPTMTKRSTGTDKLWEWADYPVGSAYSVGAHVLLDRNSNNVPLPANGNDAFHRLTYYLPFHSLDTHGERIALGQNTLPAYDKLILMNNFDIATNRFAKPHISLYNKYVRRNESPIEYAGSLTLDRYNMALGVGALQSLVPNGQTVGVFNTAVGSQSLFNNRVGNNNTAFGPGALISLGYNTANVGGYNVAIGAESQVNNKDGSFNTSVGSRSLAGIGVNTAHNNIALGSDAMSSSNPESMFFQSNNIAIGSRAGYLLNNYTLFKNDNSNRLIIGQENYENKGNIHSDKIIWPFIEAKMTDDSAPPNANPHFNINADELIVNTADGTHTILKIRMIDDKAGVALPTIGADGYSNFGYCKGEGSFDLDPANANNPEALAEVCIAKFNNNVVVETTGPNIIPADSDESFFGKIWRLLQQGAEFSSYTFRSPSIRRDHVDWDIFIKHLDVGVYGYRANGSQLGQILGIADPAHIQTVKASLNYLDTWKEGMGLLNSAMSAFQNNFLCFFQFLGADCSTATTDDPYTFMEYIKDKIEAFRDSIFSDKRLKNVSGKSTAGLKEINALKIKNYTYKADKIKTPHVGVIAQELQKIFPNSIVKGDDGYLSIKQEEMFYGLIKSIQELSNKNNTVLDKIAMTEEKIEYTEKQNKLVDQENKLLERQNREFEKRIAKLQKKDKK